MTTTERSGISRRDIIKKGAIAGAVFWSVPVIESVTSAASATSGACTPAPLTISGAAVLYTLPGSTTVYLAAFTSSGACTSTVPNDSDWSHPLNICAGIYVQVTGGTVLYGTSCGTVDPPGQTPGYVYNATYCNDYFATNSTGITVTPAGITAGVTVLMYLFHNGTFPNTCTTFGSKNHWAVACGESNPQCGTSNSCFYGSYYTCP